MGHKNIIFTSLKESFSAIWKNKALFALLFVLQIVFFAVFSFINVVYQTRIMESAKAITEYLSRQQLDEPSVADNLLQQKSILGDDPLMISRNFSDIVRNFKFYLFYIFLLLIFFISMAWSITHRLIGKISFRLLIRVFLRNFIVLLFYLGLILGFFLSLLNISFIQMADDASKLFAKYIPFLIFSAILAYFMFVSLALAARTELKNIVQRTLMVGIRKIHYVLAVYSINILLLAISILSLFYFIEKNLFILLLSLLLMIFSFVFGRILMVKYTNS
ncbi:hypothetical protein HYY71_02740 [Candidatus Woesearchaeota archaeon]|nr:hypothetical protein [Candidatus Woesearchaeota archaeon]